MQTLNEDRTVSEMLYENPSRSRIFEKYRIDYCCGGKLPLKEACAKRDVDVDTVLNELAQNDEAPATDAEPNVAEMAPDELADHIIATHHAYLDDELPRLAAMTSRVAKVHGGRDSRLIELDRVFQAIAAELKAHMGKEEQMLFPAIKEMAVTGRMHMMPFGSIANPIRMMESEHAAAGDGLERMRKLTDDYTPPEWACGTYRALLDGLAVFEKDMHQHVHKENNVLFPRAIELENRLPREDPGVTFTERD